MIDEKGNKLSEKEVLHSALGHLAEACAFLYELKSEEGKAAAFMADAALRYSQCIYNGTDPRLSHMDF